MGKMGVDAYLALVLKVAKVAGERIALLDFPRDWWDRMLFVVYVYEYT
jgi:hypothetical protein